VARSFECSWIQGTRVVHRHLVVTTPLSVGELLARFGARDGRHGPPAETVAVVAGRPVPLDYVPADGERVDFIPPLPLSPSAQRRIRARHGSASRDRRGKTP
jgi:molybdopterin converting factor small subunit